MKLTIDWLKEKSACREGIKWFSHSSQNAPLVVLNLLISEDRLQWANWLICRLMDKPSQVRYAIFAAECVLHLFEKKYPDDKRPRKAIEAAKNWLENPGDKTKAAAAADADAVADAAADDAADAAAAYTAYVAAAYAAAAYAAAYAADDAAAAAAAYAAAAYAADAAAAYAANAAAAYAADDAAYAAYAAYAAATYAAAAAAAAVSATTAADAADAAAAYTADAAAAYAADDAAYAYAYASYAAYARKTLQLKILKYGISLLKKDHEVTE